MRDYTISLSSTASDNKLMKRQYSYWKKSWWDKDVSGEWFYIALISFGFLFVISLNW